MLFSCGSRCEIDSSSRLDSAASGVDAVMARAAPVASDARRERPYLKTLLTGTTVLSAASAAPACLGRSPRHSACVDSCDGSGSEPPVRALHVAPTLETRKGDQQYPAARSSCLHPIRGRSYRRPRARGTHAVPGGHARHPAAEGGGGTPPCLAQHESRLPCVHG